jgi:hypothetical protein
MPHNSWPETHHNASSEEVATAAYVLSAVLGERCDHAFKPRDADVAASIVGHQQRLKPACFRARHGPGKGFARWGAQVHAHPWAHQPEPRGVRVQHGDRPEVPAEQHHRTQTISLGLLTYVVEGQTLLTASHLGRLLLVPRLQFWRGVQPIGPGSVL